MKIQIIKRTFQQGVCGPVPTKLLDTLNSVSNDGLWCSPMIYNGYYDVCAIPPNTEPRDALRMWLKLKLNGRSHRVCPEIFYVAKKHLGITLPECEGMDVSHLV